MGFMVRSPSVHKDTTGIQGGSRKHEWSLIVYCKEKFCSGNQKATTKG